ncbi:MAG: hypothetical protein J6C66_02255 [Prevotella sp.]|nr:hypothetical protein [Prevotella sp.]
MLYVKSFCRTLAAALACMVTGLTPVSAQNGQPNTFTGDVAFTDVTLNWQAPASDITLKWHNDYDYNGTDGIQGDPQGGVVLYVASKFTKAELKNFVGEVVDSLSMFEYRPICKLWAMIYEDGAPVMEQAVDLAGFKKNTIRKFALDKPYTIPADKDVMFVLKYEYGYNQDLTAICDDSPTVGKGNLYSSDGKTWKADAPGDYLLTAHIKNNDKTANPDGYNIYRDGVKVNSELVDTLTFSLKNEPVGVHNYHVTAVYGTTEKPSYAITLNCTSVADYIPAPSTLVTSVDELTSTLTWTAPIDLKQELTWSDKSIGTSIGATSSSPKVWVKQEFDANDLVAYPNYKITAINAYTTAAITSATIFIMKNGKIDYYQAIDEAVVTAIKDSTWTKYTLTTPYKMELGNKYAFGYYLTHAKGIKPVGTDAADSINYKGNSFSTSSPNSNAFENSKPSFKTLAQGDIPGNFLLTADVEPDGGKATDAYEVVAYDIYRDGNVIATDVKDLTYTDTVEDLGTFTYGVVAKAKDGRLSPAIEADITYSLPSAYEAPVILSSTIDENNKFDLTFSAEAAELKHYGTASYMAGFAEEMVDLLYGAKFTKEELADYVGYELSTFKFAIGEGLETFNIEVYEAGSTTPIFSEKMEGIEAGYVYTATPSSKVTIPADKDLYLVYKATLPAEKSAIIVDAGPAVDNGAMVSLTGGANWFKLGTIAPDLKDYNIVISAIALPVTSNAKEAAKAKAVVLGADAKKFEGMESKVVSLNKDADLSADDYGVEAAASAPKKVVAKKASSKPKAVSFRVYRNNEVVQEGTSESYTETISKYGVFNYHVTAIFEKGWESPASRVISINNEIKQAPVAPYELTGVENESNFNLTWKAASESPVLKVHNGSITEGKGCGLTGTSPKGYHMMKFDAASVADKVGMEISHIRFGLLDTELTSAYVVVMKNENVVYKQEVDIATLVKGWNEIRLNNPVTIEANQDLYVGYYITYDNGIKPMAGDDGPAVSGYGDVISTNGFNGYWYSCYTKYKQNYNWLIEAVLKKADTVASASKVKRAEAAVTYNVYCDGNVVATGVTATEYAVAKGAYGEYTVTAVADGVESAESNVVDYSVAALGITSVETDKAQVKAGVYSINGQAINNNGNVNGLKKGIYIVNGKKYVVK